VPSGPLTTAVVLSTIILLPAVLLLFHGYTYKTLVGRLVGAGLFTVLALAFLIDPLKHIVVLTGGGADFYNWMTTNQDGVIGLGMIVAVVDLFLTKPAMVHKDAKH